jgi:hypothetical protein
MDEFEKRLKRDADAIRPDASPELAARIEASIQGIEPIRPVEARPTSSNGLWWASSLTGLAAAIAVVVLVNWNQPAVDDVPEATVVDVTVPPDTVLTAPPIPLEISTADFASPLEEELDHLKSDLEKAREKVKKDLDFTF